MNNEPRWHDFEQAEGEPLVPVADPQQVDEHRRHTYQSYEAFLRRDLETLDAQREELWPRDYASVEAYLKSVAPLRARLKQILGFWQEPSERAPLRTWDEEVLFEDERMTARRFYLEIVPGLDTYAIEIEPKNAKPHRGLLAQHGYSGSPELVCGFVESANKPDYSYRSLGVRAALRGFRVVAVHHPTVYGTLDEAPLTPLPGFPKYNHNYGKNRLHRMATLAGYSLFGMDMMASSRGVDVLLARDPAMKIGMYGLSQGGQSALFFPALDERVAASVSSAFFNSRLVKLIGPHRATSYLDSTEEDKFFLDFVRYFSDADIASLAAPRAFAVEAGLHDSSVDFEKSHAEFQKLRVHYEKLGIPDRCEFIAHQGGHISATRRAFEFLEAHCAA